MNDREQLELKVWIGKDGVEHPVADMSTDHITNIMYALQGECDTFNRIWLENYGEDWFDLFAYETYKRKKDAKEAKR